MTSRNALAIISEIRKLNPKLNNWEQGFIDDLEDMGLSLSNKQENCLLKIYEKATGGGTYQRRQYI